MSRIKVGVLRGGPSSEYEVSLKTGKKILDLIRHENMSDEYEAIDIFIDKHGIWHMDGIPFTPSAALKKVDLIFNALHGEYGEDGKVQKVLETFSIPFTGSNALTSAMAMNKALAKKQFQSQGIKTPYHKELQIDKTVDLEPIALDLFRSFPMPVVVKPRGLGSSIGVMQASNFQELIEAIDNARQFSSDIIVEEYITGKEIISGVIDDFRGQDVYTLMPVELRPNFSHDAQPHDGGNKKILDYPSKQAGSYHKRVPANLTAEEKEQINAILKRVHASLGINHYASADFIVSPKRGVYLLEVNTQPGLNEHSPFWTSLEAAGVKAHEFLKHVLSLAIHRKA